MICIHSAHRPDGRLAPRTALTLPTITLVLFALAVPAWGGPNPSPYKLCFPFVTGLPQPDGHGGFTNPGNPPVIDGVIPGDTGWTNAFRYIFKNGSNLPLGAVQANQKGNVLYFGFQVTSDYDFDQFDAVVIGFDNTNTMDSHRYTYIYITPIKDGFGAYSSPLPANLVRVYQSADGSTWGSPQFSPGWITAAASSAGAQTMPTTPVLGWNLELSVDNSNSGGPNLPTAAGSGFGLYMNAIRTWFSYTGPLTNPDTQFTWPPGVELVDDTNPTVSSPATGSWGNGTLDLSQSCSGVFIGDIWNNVSGGSSHTNTISWTQPNTFHVNVENSSIGTPANNVTATFKIADFGLPASQEWKLLGLYPPAPGTGQDDSVPNNPTTPPGVTIPGAVTSGSPPGYIAGTKDISAGPWTLTTVGPPASGNVAWYSNDSDPNNPHTHQCILVELDSTAGDTTFINRSTWNNFEFAASASEFKSYPATVSANYSAVAGRPNQTFELTVLQQEVSPGTNYPVPPGLGREAVSGGGEEVHYLDYTVSGCRFTGKTLKMEGPPTLNADKRVIAPGQTKVFENCDGVGAYGFLIRHQGPVKVWQSQLNASGAGVQIKTLGSNQYELAIPQGKKAQLVSVVTPQAVATPPCLHLFGVGVSPLLFGGMLVVGLMLYRPRRGKSTEGKSEE